MLVYLVGNRVDLDDQRQVSVLDGQTCSIQKEFHNFVETSARTGENVHELFETLAKHLYLVNKAKLDLFVIYNVYFDREKKKKRRALIMGLHVSLYNRQRELTKRKRKSAAIDQIIWNYHNYYLNILY